MKCANFLHTNGSILLKRKSIISLLGILTGKCVESDRSVSKMCEIQTWCPVENNKLPMQGTNFGKPLSK
jgi:hypothetical protein